MDTQGGNSFEQANFIENGLENVIKIEVPTNFLQYLSSEACDLQKICRLCLTVASEADNMVPLLPDDVPGHLANQLQSFASIEILPDCQLPSHTCLVCFELIFKSYEFKLQCERADLTIKSVLKGEFVKDEPYDMQPVRDMAQVYDTGPVCDTEPVYDVEPVHDTKPDHDTDVFAFCPVDGEIEADIKDDPDRTNNSKVQPHQTCNPISKGKRKQRSKFAFCPVDGEIEADVKDDPDRTNNSEVQPHQTCNPISKGKRKQRSKNKHIKPDAIKHSRTFVKKSEIVEKATQHQCNICSKEFQKLNLLQVHIELEHSEEKVINCNKCKLTFASERDYKLHTSLHTAGRKLKCIECQKEFSSKPQLRRHIQRHMEHKKYPCELCTKTFSEQCGLTRHRHVHTGQAQEKRHMCAECGKRFTGLAALRVHSLTHTGERPIACDRCDKRFKSERLLASHMLTHDESKPHQCHYCERRFRHESTRTAHHRTHTGDRPYVCSVCGKTFMQNSNLTLHMRTHTGEKPYTCEVCGRAFSSGSSLKNHARTHTGEKPYACAVCDKRFARLDLRAHMLRHSGQRPFGCRACHKRFYTASRLRRHAAYVHSDQPQFECAKCDERFVTKSHLIKHIKTHDEAKKRKRPNKNILLVHRVTTDAPLLQNIIVSDRDVCAEEVVISQQDNTTSDIPDTMTVDLNDGIPIEATQFQDVPKTGLIALENLEDHCIAQDGVSLLNLDNSVNLVTVSEGTTIEGASVKLYQLDQSLVQIHTSGGQVTISKITSKVTANFE